MEEVREKLAAKSDVTSAACGSRSPEMEDESLTAGVAPANKEACKEVSPIEEKSKHLEAL